MQVPLKYLCFFILTFALFAAGCEGDEGPRGLMGEEGDPGEQGERGPQGPAGPGPDVTTFTFTADDLDDDDAGNRRTYTEEIAMIDSAVVDSGTVLAYLEQFEEGNVANATVDLAPQNADDSRTITVASAYVPNDGYVAIHDSTLLDGNVIGSVIGVSAYLEAGTYDDLEIELFDVPGADFPEDTTLGRAQPLIAMPHKETSGNETYNFITSGGAEDGAYTSGGSAIVDMARVTVGPGANVTFNDQAAEDSVTVTVASFYLPRDGYIAIHDSTLLDDPPVIAGSVIGVSDYFEAGTYQNVEVTLFGDIPGTDFPEDTTLQGDQVLIAMPHEETNGNEAYNFISSGGAADGPYFVDEDSDNGVVVDPATITVGDSDDGDGEEDALRLASLRLAEAGLVLSSDVPTQDVNGNAGSVWVALPYTLYMDDDGDGDADSEVSVRYGYDAGALSIAFASLSGDALDALAGEYSVKVVVIPPDADDGGSSLTVKDYDFATYREAARALGLPGAE